MLFTNRDGVCICGLGRSASLLVLAMATAIAAARASQPIPIRSAHIRRICKEHPKLNNAIS
jgi:hypothetical protein